MSTKSIRLDTSKISALRAGAVLNTVYSPVNEEELALIYAYIKGSSPIVIGGLSNTLVLRDTDRPFILTNKFKGIEVNNNYLYAKCGESLAKICHTASEHGLSNLESLSGIPGTVGGAVKNNSGSYGSCISDCLDRVYVFDWDTGVTEERTREQIAFNYRYSNLRQDKDIILGASFVLSPIEAEFIAKRMKEVSMLRKMAQPQGKSLGSVFKRYEGVSAGYYIEKAGLKGYNRNGMEISKIHANFIVNKGGSVDDYLYLLNLAKTKVYEQFGIKLEEEVRIIGLQQCIEDSE